MKFKFLILFLLFLSGAVNSYSLNIPIVNEGKITSFNNFSNSMFNLIVKNDIEISKQEWLTELLLNKEKSFKRKIFLIKNKNIISNLGLSEKNIYSLNEIYYPFINKLNLFLSLSSIKSYERTKDQNEFLDIYYSFLVSLKLSTLLNFLEHKFIYEGSLVSEYDILINKINIKDVKKRNDLLFIEDPILSDILKKIGNFYIFPLNFKWINLDLSLNEIENDGVKILNDLIKKFNYNENCRELNIELNNYYYNFLTTEEKFKVFFENIYNKFPFIFLVLVFYFISFILMTFFLKFKINLLYNISYYFFIFGFFLSFLIILLRIFISFRAPVSTLFESILFVNFMISFLLFFLINKQNNNITIIFSLFFISLFQYIIYRYNIENGSIKVLLPVLNTNFWLTVHVSTITIGYALCIIFSILGHVLMIMLLKYDKNSYIVLKFFNLNIFFCIFALSFLVVGTFLGGIWADQSWGRFWGWDPKENGALLIIIWLVFILHARFTNIFSFLFFSIFSILTNVIVSLSWFGVNLLNIGLHSYGFIENIGTNLLKFFVFELFFILFFLFFIFKKNKNYKL